MGEGTQQDRGAGPRAGDTSARSLDPRGRHLADETLPLPPHLSRSHSFTVPAVFRLCAVSESHTFHSLIYTVKNSPTRRAIPRAQGVLGSGPASWSRLRGSHARGLALWGQAGSPGRGVTGNLRGHQCIEGGAGRETVKWEKWTLKTLAPFAA